MRNLFEQQWIRLAAFAGLSAGALLVSSQNAVAADDWYVRVSGGVSYLADDDSAKITDETGTQKMDASFDLGYGVALAAGRWFDDRWRADIEWAYRSNDNDRLKLDDGRVGDSGNFASSGLSLNGYYHFTPGREIGRVSPYVGAGVVWINEVDMDIENGEFGKDYEDLEDDGFGAQFMAGLSYRQTERWRWDAEIRWLYYGEVDMDNDRGTRVKDLDYAPLSFFVGASYSF
jgi:outer membrane protein W